MKILNGKYDLELDRIVSEIKRLKAKLVLLQFPDGLKPYATDVVDFLEKELTPNQVGLEEGVHSVKEDINTECKFLIWFGTCFGACDTPVLSREIEKKIDLVVQFGHNSLQPKI